MPRPCSVCIHGKRNEIDTALVRGTESYRILANRHQVSFAAIQRHAAKHLALEIAVAQTKRIAKQEVRARSLGDYLIEQVEQAVEIRDSARKAAPTDDGAMARWTAASHVAMKGIGLMVRVGEALERNRRK